MEAAGADPPAAQRKRTGIRPVPRFRDRVTQALSRLRRRRPIAVLFLDPDDFKAMYLAKGAGGGSYAVYEPSMHLRAAERVSLRNDLERVVPDDELYLVYQPIIELASGAVIGVEALVRWRHPLRGVISPATFIPIAEESGAIVTIGSWVLRRACEQVAAIGGPGRELSVAVNVSARQLQDRDLPNQVAAILSETGLRPDRLVLEVTESTLVRDMDGAIETLRGLRALGIRLAIDDFGTGYSSLTYLHRFPVDILKIDRSFVASITAGPSEASLVGSIIRMATTLGLRTIAEGIEQEAQLAALRRVGAHEGQGYLLGYPRELAGLELDLRDGDSATMEPISA